MSSAVKRINALVLHEFYLTRRSVELLFDILLFPMMNVILFGLITRFMGEGGGAQAGLYLMVGILLWEIVTIVQYNVTVSTLWSVWSHNLTNFFITPTSVPEYMTAHAIAAVLRAILVVTLLSVGTYFVFGFNILQLGWLNLILFFVNLALFAFWLGMILLGLVFRFGTRIQAISWGTIFMFQPLTASFFPVTVLPHALQIVAFALPPTYVFESGRQALTTHAVNWEYIGVAFALNIGYLILAAYIFRYLFRRSKITGQFARNDLG